MKTIYYNGKIITMNEKQPFASAVLVNDGKIEAVGKSEEILKLQDDKTTLIDLDKMTLLPGFIDGHSHFVGLANSLSQCDLSEAKNFEDIVSLMKKYIQSEHIEEGQWVIGSNYDHNFLSEKHHPTKWILDEISLQHPICIVHASSHMGVVNSKALEILGVKDSVQDPEGGRYGRYQGELSGYLEENAFISFQSRIPMIPVERLLQLMVKAQDIYASYGITTIQEGMVNSGLWQLLCYANETGILKLDVVGYIDLIEHRDLLQQHKAYVNCYQNHLKIGGYKIFLDGSPQGRTAYMSTPYEGSESYCGYPILSDQQVEKWVKVANDDNQQLLAHCNGDGACEQFVQAFEKVGKGYRPVMVHAQLVRKDQLKRMKAIEMMPSFFVAHTYYWGDVHIANFGYERAKNISPAQSAIQCGLPYTFHQDSPVLLPDMVKTIQCAIERKTRNGIELNPKERITAMQALKGVTVYGAYQYFEENSKGSIEVGKRADLVILNDKGVVLKTIKDGQCIYSTKN